MDTTDVHDWLARWWASSGLSQVGGFEFKLLEIPGTIQVLLTASIRSEFRSTEGASNIWSCTFEQVYLLSRILRHGRWLCSDVAIETQDSRRTTLSRFIIGAPWTHANTHDLRRFHWYGWNVLCPQYKHHILPICCWLMRRSMSIVFPLSFVSTTTGISSD